MVISKQIQEALDGLRAIFPTCQFTFGFSEEECNQDKCPDCDAHSCDVRDNLGNPNPCSNLNSKIANEIIVQGQISGGRYEGLSLGVNEYDRWLTLSLDCTDVSFVNCNFNNVNIKGKLKNCTFQYCNFGGHDGFCGSFEGCSLEGVSFNDCDFEDLCFTRNAYKDTVFRGDCTFDEVFFEVMGITARASVGAGKHSGLGKLVSGIDFTSTCDFTKAFFPTVSVGR